MNLSTPRALIFDMDGTIVNNIPYHMRAWEKVFTQNGRVFDPSTFHAQNHGTIEETIRHFFGQHLSDEEARLLGEAKESAYRELYRGHIEELPGLIPLLHTARSRGIRTGLATMGGAANIQLVLEGLSAAELFNVIMGGHQVQKGKPDPEIFDKVIRQLGVEPGAALVFEDSHAGVQAALAAGAGVVGVCTSHSPEDFSNWGVHRTVDNFKTFSNMYLSVPA